MGPIPLLSRIVRVAASGVLLALVTRTVCAETVRIVGAVDGSRRVVVAGSVSPRLKVANDLGQVDGSTRLEGMSLRFSRTPEQEAALTKLLADQQDPASGKYHQWLTPEQFRAQFGVGASDVAKVSDWLTAQGFTVTETARGGGFVRFTGTVAQAQAAFQTEIHAVMLDGVKHLANVTAPSLPAAIAAMTTGVSGLDDFRATPRNVVRPEYSAGGVNHIAPADFYTIYDEKSLLTGNVMGKGVTVAIAGQTDIFPADIAAFQVAAGLPNVPVTQMLYGADPGFPSTGDLTEAELDLEWAGAIAPGASLVFVNSADVLEGSVTEAIDNNVASIVAVSYGYCEASLGETPLAFYSQILEQGAAEGITVTGVAGDSGATDCDAGVASALNGLAVDFPASSPLVTGVGGTELNEGSGTYWSGTNGTTGGSALSYIPEVVWNDDSGTGLAAGGGGASLFYPKPSWQVGTGVPADYSRDVPDVAFSASIAHDGYLICTNVAAGSCVNGFADASGNLVVAGGTSFGAPIFAGLLALVEQQTGGKPMGSVNPVIYALANSTYAGNVFHDVTSGTNASPCTMGSTGCANGGTIGYAATHGYDQASGWGSVDAYALVNDWALVTPLATTPAGVTPSVTNLAGNATSVNSGVSIAFTITVAAATNETTATPTGTVQLTVDNVAVGAPVTLAAGAATYTLATSGLSAGSHTVQATYAGDATFLGSKAAFAITVLTPGKVDFALTPSTASVTVASGAIAQGVPLTVTSLNGFAGQVQFYASMPTAFAGTVSFTINPVTVSATTTSASTAFTVLAYTNISQNEKRGMGWYRAGAGVMLAGVMLLVLPRRRKLTALLVMGLSVGAISAGGCSAPALPTTTTATTKGTPAGTYSILISASTTINSVVTVHYTTVNVTVQ